MAKGKAQKEIMLRVREKKRKIESKPFPISWLIIGGDDIEFPTTGETLPVKDLAYFFVDYEIILDQSNGELQKPCN